jgi:hypothetical protein
MSRFCVPLTQHDQRLAAAGVIHPAARARIDSKLAQSVADRLLVTEIAEQNYRRQNVRIAPPLPCARNYLIYNDFVLEDRWRKRHNNSPSAPSPSRDACGLGSLMSSTVGSFKRIDDHTVSRGGRYVDNRR